MVALLHFGLNAAARDTCEAHDMGSFLTPAPHTEMTAVGQKATKIDAASYLNIKSTKPTFGL
jgi:hypothetical protein